VRQSWAALNCQRGPSVPVGVDEVVGNERGEPFEQLVSASNRKSVHSHRAYPS
jgi:hypothetical protein